MPTRERLAVRSWGKSWRRALLVGAAPISLLASQAAAGVLPSGFSSLAGVTAPTISGATETVNQTGARGYIDWTSFSISAGGAFVVNDTRASAASDILVNRVTGTGESDIAGTITSPGQFWLINPNGVLVEQGAAINVGGLLLSTAAFDAQQAKTFRTSYLGGNNNFAFTGSTSAITVNGTVTAAGGFVGFIGASVGIGGSVTTAAGSASPVLAVAAQGLSLDLTAAAGGVSPFFVLSGVTITKGSGTAAGVTVASGASITADRIVIAAEGATAPSSIVVSGALSATAARGDGEDIVLVTADQGGASTQVLGGANPLPTGGVLSTSTPLTTTGGDITLTPPAGADGVTAVAQAGLIVQAAGSVTLGTVGAELPGGDVSVYATANILAPAGATLFAGQDISLTAANVNLNALAAGRDVAIEAKGADPAGGAALTIGAAAAADDIVLRADAGSVAAASLASGQTLTIGGAVYAGGNGDADTTGAGDVLAAARPDPFRVAGATETGGDFVDVTAAGSLTVTGATLAGTVAGLTTPTGLAGSDVWLLAGGAVSLGDVSSLRDIAIRGASIGAGNLVAGRDIAAQATAADPPSGAALTLASATAADDVVLRADVGSILATGALASGQTIVMGSTTFASGNGDADATAAGDRLNAAKPVSFHGLTQSVSGAGVVSLEAAGGITVGGPINQGPGGGDGDAWLIGGGPIDVGGVYAGRDIVIQGGPVTTGDLAAGRDIAAESLGGALAIGAAAAADDVVLRADAGSLTATSLASGQTLTIGGNTYTGGAGDAATTGAGDVLAAALPDPLRGATPTEVGGDFVDVTATASITVSGATLAGTVAGLTTPTGLAGSDAWLVASGPVSLGDVSAMRDIALRGTTVAAGNLVAGRDIAIEAVAVDPAGAAALTLASATAADDVVLRADLGSISATGALASGQTIVMGSTTFASANGDADATAAGDRLNAAKPVSFHGLTQSVSGAGVVSLEAGGGITVGGPINQGPGGGDGDVWLIGGGPIDVGGVYAGRDIVIQGGPVTTGDLQAGRDIAAESLAGALTIGAAAAADDIVLRADAGSVTAASLASGQTLSIGGNIYAGGNGDAAATGAGDVLAGALPLTLFGIAGYDTSYRPLTGGAIVDVSGSTVTVTGATTAGVTGQSLGDVWMVATGPDSAPSTAISLGGVTATQDIALEASDTVASGGVATGQLTAGRDVAIRSALGGIAIGGSITAGDDVMLFATAPGAGQVTVSGALASGTAATADNTGAASDLFTYANAPTALKIFGQADVALSGGVTDVWGQNVTLTGPVTAGYLAGTAVTASSATPTQAGSDVRVVALGADTGGAAALQLTGGARASGSIALEASDTTAAGSIGGGALNAVGDVAAWSHLGSLSIASSLAGDDLVLRAAGAVSVTGNLQAGVNPDTGAAGTDTGQSGWGDALAAADPSTFFATATSAGITYSDLTNANDVDVFSGTAITIGGSASAVGLPQSDLRLLATGPVTLTGSGTATRDIVIEGSNVATGGLGAGRDIAVLATTANLTIASGSAGDDVMLFATASGAGQVTVTGALASGTAATADDTGAASDLFAYANTPTPLKIFGQADVALSGGVTDVWGQNVTVSGPVTAGYLAGTAVTASSATPTQAGSDVRVVALGADTGGAAALQLTGGARASGSIALEASDTTAAGSIGGGALNAVGDVAAWSHLGSLSIASAMAGDDLVLRAAGAVSVTGNLQAGVNPDTGAAGTDTGQSGWGDALAAADPSTFFATATSAGITYSDLTGANDVDVFSGTAITIGGSASAVGLPQSDLRLLATGPVTLTGSGTATRDIVIEGSNVATGGLGAGRDIAVLATTANLTIASGSAGDDVMLFATAPGAGQVTVSGALASGTSTSVDNTGAASDLFAYANTPTPLKIFGQADVALSGGVTDVWGQNVTLGGPVTAGYLAGTAVTASSATPTQAGSDVRVVALGADTVAGPALQLTGGARASGSIALEASDTTLAGSIGGGALNAVGDVAAWSHLGSLSIASSLAGDDLVLRAAGAVSVTGNLQAGVNPDTGAAGTDTGQSGWGDALAAADPSTFFATATSAGITYSDLTGANDVDVFSGTAITIGGSASAVGLPQSDLRLLATGPVTLTGSGAATRDIVIQGSSVATGGLGAGRDIAVLATTANLTIASGSAGDDVMLFATASGAGQVTVTGALASGTAATADNTGAASDLFAYANTPTALKIFGQADVALSGGVTDVWGQNVTLGGPVTAGYLAGTAVTASSATPTQAGSDVRVVALGADTVAGPALQLTGGARASGSIALEASDTTVAGSIGGGALNAVGDVAAWSHLGSLSIASSQAGDDLVLRAAGAVSVTGNLQAGVNPDTGAAGTDTGQSGWGDALAAADPSTFFATATSAGITYSDLTNANDVDVFSGTAITIGGSASAVGLPQSDLRLLATGPVTLTGSGAATRDIVIQGSSVATGGLGAGRDIAVRATSANLSIAAGAAGDDLALMADSGSSVVTVGGTLSSAAAGNNAGAANVLAVGEAPQALTALAGKQIVLSGAQVALGGTVSAGATASPTGDVIVLATAPGQVTVGDVTGATSLFSKADIALVQASSLDVFAGRSPASSASMTVGDITFQSGAGAVPTIRLYAGFGATVTVQGQVTGATNSVLAIGDAATLDTAPTGSGLTRFALLPAYGAAGWTPSSISVTGAIDLGVTSGQLALAAGAIYIDPIAAEIAPGGLLRTTQLPAQLPAYTGAVTQQIQTATLELRAASEILERNLSRNLLTSGVGLQVGATPTTGVLLINTLTADATPIQRINLFGALHGLDGISSALSIRYAPTSGFSVAYPQPSSTIAKNYLFNTCQFGGGVCYVTMTPVTKPTVPNPDQIGDLSDPYALVDEEPVTNSGGEVQWSPSTDKEPSQ